MCPLPLQHFTTPANASCPLSPSLRSIDPHPAGFHASLIVDKTRQLSRRVTLTFSYFLLLFRRSVVLAVKIAQDLTLPRRTNRHVCE